MRKNTTDFYAWFSVCSEVIQVNYKYWTSFWVNSQIWLNLFGGGLVLFLHLPTNDSHFGYEKEFQKKF